MLTLANASVNATAGLLITFGGIGVVATGIIIYIFVQINGEREQNREHTSSRRQPGT
jgi:hypothetical protein